MINIVTPEIYYTNAKGEILIILKNKNLGSGKDHSAHDQCDSFYDH